MVTADEERLCFLAELDPRAGQAHHIVRALRIDGEIDTAALRRAVDCVATRHAALRTGFTRSGERVRRVSVPAPRLPLSVVDLPESVDEDGLAVAVANVVSHPFELSSPPLVRVALMRTRAYEILVLCAHEAALDGWGLAAMLADIVSTYNAPLDEPVPTPAPPSRQAAPDPTTDDGHLNYWRTHLSGLPVLDLPTDRPRPPIRTFTCGARSRAMPTTAELPTALAAFAVLLARYGMDDEVVFGLRGSASGTGGDRPADTHLVLRVDLSDTDLLRDVVERVDELSRSAERHRVPFGDLVRVLRPAQDSSRSPLFQVTFAVRNEPAPPGRIGGAPATVYEMAPPAMEYELALELVPAADTVRLTYNAGLYDGATAERMLDHYVEIVQAVTTDPGQPWRRLDMMSAAERASLAMWGTGPAVHSPLSCVDELVERQASARPQAVALVRGDRSLTYGQLNRWANRIAHGLRDRGVGAGALVAVLAERSFEMVAAFLGVLKAGAAYVPIDPVQPADRVRFLLEDSGARVVLGQERLLVAHTVPRGVAAVALDGGWPGSGGPDHDPPRVTNPTDLVYVSYTSGSTGQPKGVMVEHRGVVRVVQAPSYVRLDHNETMLQTTSPSFDVSAFEIWGALVNGARLALPPPDPPDVAALGAFVQEVGVTTMWLTAGLFHEFVESGLSYLAGLRQLVAGGDVLSPERCRAVLTAHPGVTLINGYGPTEGTIFACAAQVRPELVDSSVPIGRPVDHTGVRILDRHGRMVPVGVPGEIYLSGPGVARGYLGRPELTAASFVDHDGERMYRTGDLARWRPDGLIQFLGRTDGQVKVRGFRVELGEVEATIGQHPLVSTCAVVADETPTGKRLAAYVVPSGPELPGFTAADLRLYLDRRLPAYMVPTVQLVPDIPLTASGKLDRAALAALGPPGAEEVVGSFGSPAQDTLAGLWAEILGCDRTAIGPHSDFFSLGGDSLLVNRLIAGVRKIFGVTLPLRSIFERPTVSGVEAEILSGLGRPHGGPEPISAEPRPDRVPLSFAQRGLWFLDQLNPGSVAYNLPMPFRLYGRVDSGALAKAANAVVVRHEALRTVFRSSDGEPYQVILPPATLPLRRAAWPAETDEARIQDWISARAAEPFDLATDSLIRFDLLSLGDDEHVLLVTAHHAVSDALSADVLRHELATGYEAIVAGGEPVREPLPVQYADFAVWQHRHLRGDTRDALLSYWRRRLRGAPAWLDLPTDGLRPPVQTFDGATEWFTIPAELAARLRETGRSEGTTLFMTLLAGFQLLLSRHSGQRDVVVGAPVANRSQVEVQRLIGFFVNTVALRLDLSGDPTVRDVLQRVRESALGAYAHQDLPFELLVEARQPDRDPSRPPIFQALFNLVPPSGEPDPAGLGWVPVVPRDSAAKYDLSLYVWDGPADLRCSLTYNTSLFSDARMRDVVVQYLQLLAGLCGPPGQRVAKLCTAGTAAGSRLPDPGAPLPAGAVEPVVARVARVIRESPDRLATAGPDGAWTYADLDGRVTELAGSLRGRGAQAGAAVAVLAGRTPWLAVALLATMRTGAAFALLDPDQPAPRLRRQLDHVRPVAVLDVRTAGFAQWYTAPAGDTTADLDGAFCVLFTSGSSGEPQGVVSGSQPLARFLAWQSERFGLTERDRFAVLSGLGHDPVLRDVFGGLCLGATVCWPTAELLGEPEDLVCWLRAESVTVVHVTPALLETLGVVEGRPVASLRYVFSGGAPLTDTHVAVARRLAPNATVVNFYGATETPQAVAYHVVPPRAERPVLPIGVGAGDAQLLVCRERQLRCGVGELGEVGVRSPHLARGYLTAGPRDTGFTANPFGTTDTDRVYWTGDLGRYLPDGGVVLAGRVDRQLNLRGFRVEPAEVEAALRHHPDVWEVAVNGSEGSSGTRLAAFVVPRPGEAPSPGVLREHARTLLPPHLVPDTVVLTDSLPRLSNGKVDYAALRAPRVSGAATARTPTLEVRDEIEAAIVELWRELLGEAPAHRDQSFFEVGHSLLAVRLVVGIRRRLSVKLPLHRVFDSATVARLAAAVRSAAEGRDDAATGLGRVGRER